jgi:NADH dehydrogenase
MTGSQQIHRVVIAGGGAGGLELATRLTRRPVLDVVLIDREEAHLWKPLLHELASGSLDAGAHEVSYLALARRHGFTFHHGPLIGLAPSERRAIVGPVTDRDGATIIPERRIGYDILVIAIGGTSNDFGVPGVHEHALALDSAADAEEIRSRLVKACMAANYAEDERRDRLDIVIIGGGATGVELAGELRATTKSLISYGLDRLAPEAFIAITVLNADPRLLVQLPEPLAEAVTQSLRDLRVNVRNSTAVVEVMRDGVRTKAGEILGSDITVWAAGVKAPEVLRGLQGLETNREGQLMVTPQLRVGGADRIFAIGDCAACPWLGHGGLVPARAQASHQQAAHLARNIPRLLAGRPLERFRYRDLGSLVSLGPEGSAIGTLMSFVTGRSYRVEGLLARAFYKWLYKRHRAAMFGWWAVLLETVGGWIGGVTKPGSSCTDHRPVARRHEQTARSAPCISSARRAYPAPRCDRRRARRSCRNPPPTPADA